MSDDDDFGLDDVSISLDELDVPPAPPFSDEESERVIDEAVASLVILRFPAALEDAAAELHALASLIAETTARLPDAVARALDQDYSWRDVAICLGSTPEVARRRYGTAREEPPLED